MSSDNVVINVAGLSKCYNIYDKPLDRLKQSIVPRLYNVIGKPSPAYYREFWALHDISFSVKKGEAVGVIGRNGSGKSTLLQLICGTLTPTGGQVETRGRITALLELGSGFNPEFTGRENIFLNGAILGLSQEEIEARFDDIAAFADIGDFLDQPVKFYSSGMTVRLAFAVQAMVDPDILVVDEALAVGDERFQRKCFRRLEELRKNGTSILFVSHAGQQIVELCDRALLLEQGKRLLTADPLTTVRAYHRMLFAHPAEQPRLIQEIIEKDNKHLSGPNISSFALVDANTNINMPTTSQPISDVQETDFYQENLIPESTQVYPLQGARLDSLKIYNTEGKQVNNLLSGREYIFEIGGTFLEDRELVYIGFHIRATNGTELTGRVYPRWGKYLERVKPGQRFRLAHRIKMSLAPNVYFSGAGIWSANEPVCLHKVVDAAMFRVMPRLKNDSFGHVDLSVGEPEFEML